MYFPTFACLLGALVLPAITQAFEHTPLELAVPRLHAIKQLHKSTARGLSPRALPYTEHNLSVPIDHFHNDSRYAPHTSDEFSLRYWFDASHYRKGGPVIVIAAGETDATDRFPFLSQGVVTQLAKAHHGIGVILEHRYYGSSFPFDSLDTDNIRFLSTDQALADYAYFAEHVTLPGLEHVDLSPKSTPWIAYGGSYAGAFVAFLRKLYPEVYWGAVSSSGVTQAIIDYWQYYEPIRQYAPSDCIRATQEFIDVVDRVLIDHAENKTLNSQLKTAFGASAQYDDVTFASSLSVGLDDFQGRNWDPAIGSLGFRRYCDNITATDLLYPETKKVEDSIKQIVDVAGYDAENETFVTQILNHVGFLDKLVFSYSDADLDSTSDSDPNPIASNNSTAKPLPKSSGTSWSYQVCTEWGYFTTGTGVPNDTLPLISRVLDIPALSSFCPSQFGITTPPQVENINQHGGYDFSFPRVAIIDGLADPWRDATPHADGTAKRESSDEEPFILLDIAAEDVWDGVRGAVHHWDQNGVVGNQTGVVPKEVKEVQKEVVRFVGVWLEKWSESRNSTGLRKGVAHDLK
ncbi:hydrolytic enzymes of the alpha/beta hydrolase fold protein [Aspergillus steynii IBT 23096]|uniref:Hydrolytic enzymes of the alpha/beta hydrolase fold protein n=1 Tax=Aspergillus steynii IBT 23096 TaxID=1392250 RepID=A0A2I2GEG8_9EURO|nr:hydrolytic enzymes of the alpha/beta hydrolase fold protein [Aspergillus steynii IBT 23096]PLB51285.1 hydrolytic enzymes of the alpha/beta hydrolase fold protein [Aspergillus steynii IBT 23096]